MSKNIKKIIIILVILILVVIGVSLFTGGEPSNQNQLQSLNTGMGGAPLSQNAGTSQALMDTEEINREFLSMLLNLESINLEDDIFSEPAFTALVDNTVRLNQPGNEGRPNPFAPIGVDGLYGSISETNLEASVGSSMNDMSDEAVTAETETSEQPQDVNLESVDSSDDLTDEQLQQGISNLGNS